MTEVTEHMHIDNQTWLLVFIMQPFICLSVSHTHTHTHPHTPYTYTICSHISGPSLVAQSVKALPAMQETWVRSLGWEDPLEKEIATHSSILA